MTTRAKELALERCPKSDDVIEEARNRIRRNIFISGYKAAQDDIVELIQHKIDSNKSGWGQGYWMDAKSELQDIISLIKDN